MYTLLLRQYPQISAQTKRHCADSTRRRPGGGAHPGVARDGLSRAVSQSGDPLQAPAAVFVRDGEHYRGRLRIFDAFATNAWIHLNARVQDLVRGGKHLLVFEVSPHA